MPAQYWLAVALATITGCAADTSPIDTPCPAGGSDRAACEAAGGAFGSLPHDLCFCPTGDTNQRCGRAEDCAYACVARPGTPACATATVGHCLQFRPETSCGCFLGAAGASNVDTCAE